MLGPSPGAGDRTQKCHTSYRDADTTWVSIAYYNFDFQAGLGHPQQSQHLVPTARNLATLGNGGHWRLQGLIKYQQDPNDKFFVREEAEAQRGEGTWPRSQGKSENTGIGFRTPTGSGGPRQPVMPQNSQNVLFLMNVPRKSFSGYKY